MARIYQTRNLIDPSMIQYVGNRADKNLAYSNAQTERNAKAVADMIKPLGSLADMGIRAYNTRDLIDTDPILNAAREEYIRTGSSSPLMSYQLQKMAAEQRAAEAEKQEAEKNRLKDFHTAVRIAQARPEYAKIQKSMLDAVDAGDMETADIMQKQLQAYETEFGADTFGQDAASILESRKKAKILADEKKAIEKAEQEEIELGERNLKAIQDVNENERLHRVALFKNSLPTTFAKETDKQFVYDQIEANEDMTLQEKTKLMDEIRGIESGLTQTKKSKQSARASAAGEEIKEQIKISKETKKLADEAKKALAAGYILTADEKDAYDTVYGGK